MSTSIPTQYIPGAGSITMFSTSRCCYCNELKKHLTKENIPYREIDIETDPALDQIVRALNNGNQVVPTIIFPDASTASNPTLQEVQTKLDA